MCYSGSQHCYPKIKISEDRDQNAYVMRKSTAVSLRKAPGFSKLNVSRSVTEILIDFGVRKPLVIQIVLLVEYSVLN